MLATQFKPRRHHHQHCQHISNLRAPASSSPSITSPPHPFPHLKPLLSLFLGPRFTLQSTDLGSLFLWCLLHLGQQQPGTPATSPHPASLPHRGLGPLPTPVPQLNFLIHMSINSQLPGRLAHSRPWAPPTASTRYRSNWANPMIEWSRRRLEGQRVVDRRVPHRANNFP
ncbi:hypothetical protein EI94DRAFT_137241 [Lactarius quietus]|nr:hypothetical protein EI94DRAFT_137241 [Lactarius quietus]